MKKTRLWLCLALCVAALASSFPAPTVAQEPNPLCGLLGQAACPTTPPPGGGGTTPTPTVVPPPPPPAPEPDKSSPAPTGGGTTSPTPPPPPGEPPAAPPAPGDPSAAAPPPPPAAAASPLPAGPAVPLLQVPNIARSKPRTTARLMEIFQPLLDQGIPFETQIVAKFTPFPVAGLAFFSHDWGFPRYTPYPHLHEGTDIFAECGTPIIASEAGILAGFGNQGVGGLSVWLSSADGSGRYYTHLSGFPPGLQAGQPVEAGTVIGYVGNTGNAASTACHLHFEIHPAIYNAKGKMIAGGASPSGTTAHTNTPPADPKPYLDQWLDQAEANAEAYVGEVLEQYLAIPKEAHIARRMNDLFNEVVERPGEMLTYAMQQPELGVLALARQTAADEGLARIPGSLSERTAEQQRRAEVRQAVAAPQLAMAALTGLSLFDAPAASAD